MMIRDDGETLLNFVWGTAGPSQECGIPADDFSVRWSRRLLLNDGLYRFSITADDGVRFSWTAKGPGSMAESTKINLQRRPEPLCGRPYDRPRILRTYRRSHYRH
ncbi:MAG: hypothetical protein IPG76_06450 [Acidobacteria bacterium]|nr:hypothetical protein [Acidobacteriota bacterium]